MIRLTEHYKQRYKERVSKSSMNMQAVTDEAFCLGKDLDQIENKKMKKQLSQRPHEDWEKCKIYRGYVWWFSATTALTVYPLPRV